MTACPFCEILLVKGSDDEAGKALYLLHLIADHGLLVGEIKR